MSHIYPENLTQLMSTNAIDHVEVIQCVRDDSCPEQFQYTVLLEEDCDLWELQFLWNQNTKEIKIIDTGARGCIVFPLTNSKSFNHRLSRIEYLQIPNPNFAVAVLSKYSKSQIGIETIMSFFFMDWKTIYLPVQCIR